MKPIKTTHHRRTGTCPACQLEVHGSTGEGRPRPGDLTVCAGCATLLAFDDPPPLLRHLTPRERAKVEADRELAAKLDLMREVLLRLQQLPPHWQGVEQVRCDHCGQAVWLSRDGREQRRTKRLRVECSSCAAKRLERETRGDT